MLKLSHSSLSAYSECPFKWKLKYVDRVPERPKHYFSFGTAIHSALQAMYEGEACLPVGDVIDEFLLAWSPDGYKDGKAEAKAQREGQDMLREFHARFAPEWSKPLAVEVEFLFPVYHVPVRGYVDRVDILPDGSLHVLDYKTGRDVAPDRAATDDQLTMYQMAVEHLFPESRVGRLSLLHVPTRTWHSSPSRGAEACRLLRNRLLEVARAISDSQFPCSPSSGACQWCDHKALCPAWRP